MILALCPRSKLGQKHWLRLQQHERERLAARVATQAAEASFHRRMSVSAEAGARVIAEHEATERAQVAADVEREKTRQAHTRAMEKTLAAAREAEAAEIEAAEDFDLVDTIREREGMGGDHAG